mmetsp:Transcript_14904/g.41195  ORF Transcript_14904/g.41195 Transcript_14904/m.41195 type:complete len:220 (-) Transcript_14904:128-787(-)
MRHVGSIDLGWTFFVGQGIKERTSVVECRPNVVLDTRHFTGFDNSFGLRHFPVVIHVLPKVGHDKESIDALECRGHFLGSSIHVKRNDVRACFLEGERGLLGRIAGKGSNLKRGIGIVENGSGETTSLVSSGSDDCNDRLLSVDDALSHVVVVRVVNLLVVLANDRKTHLVSLACCLIVLLVSAFCWFRFVSKDVGHSKVFLDWSSHVDPSKIELDLLP